MDVGHYKKKPVTVEAVQWDGTPEQGAEIVEWINGLSGDAHYREVVLAPDGIPSTTALSSLTTGMRESGWDGRSYVEIVTLEGVMQALEGDWVIRGVAGEFYPCKDPIFEQTYTSVRRW